MEKLVSRIRIFASLKSEIDYFYFHAFIHWLPTEQGWNLKICKHCGLLIIYASKNDPEYHRWIPKNKLDSILKLNEFALQWHVRGYDEDAERLHLPNDVPTFSINDASKMKENTKWVHTFFLYKRE